MNAPTPPSDVRSVAPDADYVVLTVIPIPTQQSKSTYTQRRLARWRHSTSQGEGFTASTDLPLASQVEFRRKLLLVVAAQVLWVWTAIVLATFCAPVRDRVAPTSVASASIYLEYSSACLLGTLALLCVLRSVETAKLLALLLFSTAQAATLIGLDVLVCSHVSVFNCGATFVGVLLLLLLSGVRVRRNTTLPSPLLAGFLSYAVVVCASCMLYVGLGERFVGAAALGVSLLVQLALLAWFAWDLGELYHVLAADEFAHGVVCLYVDMVLVVFFALVLVATAAMRVLGRGRSAA